MDIFTINRLFLSNTEVEITTTHNNVHIHNNQLSSDNLQSRLSFPQAMNYSSTDEFSANLNSFNVDDKQSNLMQTLNTQSPINNSNTVSDINPEDQIMSLLLYSQQQLNQRVLISDNKVLDTPHNNISMKSTNEAVELVELEDYNRNKKKLTSQNLKKSDSTKKISNMEPSQLNQNTASNDFVNSEVNNQKFENLIVTVSPNITPDHSVASSSKKSDTIAHSSANKKTKNLIFQNILKCSTCEKQFCKIYTKTSNNVTSNLCCYECSKDPQILVSRKRNYAETQIVCCDLCRKSIAKGDLKVESSSLEVICFHCVEKYKFCTECGGGGKFRGGKYRPIELFVSDKKTCSLSHLRIGTQPITFQSFTVGVNTSKYLKLFGEFEIILRDGVCSLFAHPQIIEKNGTKYPTFQALDDWIKKVYFAMRTSLNVNLEDSGILRYIIVGSIKNEITKKIPKKKNGINMQHSTKNLKMSFGFFELNMNMGTLCLRPFSVKMMASTVYITLKQMISKALEIAQIDCATNKMGIVKFVWFAVDKDNHKLEQIFDKIGFELIDKFVKLNPTVDKAIFYFVDRPHESRGQEQSDFNIFVANASLFENNQ
ncbi:hypothetical protein HDU92_004576 [Lobulomyces angularis]|nr:hypothetical protein HDU92_004576 [Lobulomyces angularis]